MLLGFIFYCFVTNHRRSSGLKEQQSLVLFVGEPRGQGSVENVINGAGAARSTLRDAVLTCWLLSGSSAGPRAGSLDSLPGLLGLSYNMVSSLQTELFVRLGLRKGVQHPFHSILAIRVQIAGKKT